MPDSSPSSSSPPGEPVIRSYRAEDHAAVEALYQRGLLSGALDPNDTAADLDHMEEAYFQHPKDHFWVAELAGEVVGCIGVAHDASIAQVRRLRVAPEQQRLALGVRLLDTALRHCRRHAVLKVVLDTHLNARRATELLSQSGFQFARNKQTAGKNLLEFYYNLYQGPQPQAEAQATAAAASQLSQGGAGLAEPASGPDAGQSKLRIVLADDHRIFRTSLAGLLRDEPDLRIIGEANDGQQAVELARRVRPDLVIMDVNMPGQTGVQATRTITRELPRTRVVGLSMYERHQVATLMLEAGASAYLPKDAPANMLISAIRG